MSNKDLLKLENEYRNELPKYKTKPLIVPIKKSISLTKRVSDFLAETSKSGENSERQTNERKSGNSKPSVEMDIYVTPTEE